MIKKFVFCFLLCFLIIDANCETSVDNNLNNIPQDIETEEQKSRQLDQHKEYLNSLLADIEKRYGETAALLKKLHKEIERKNLSLNKIHTEISLHKSEIGRQNKELAGQIRSAYAMGQKEKLKLLLNQQDPGLSSRMMMFYSYVNKARVKKLAEFNKTVKRLDDLEKKQVQEALQLEKKVEQKKAEQALLDGARNQRNELLGQINDNSFSNAEQLSYVLENENKLKALINGLQNSGGELITDPTQEEGFAERDDGYTENADTEVVKSGSFDENFSNFNVAFSILQGKLPWPVQGRIVQKFGSPRSDGVWDGVLIDAKEGMDIHAVNRGKVVYAEWLRGYGLLIIIDHGQGYMTLYAFNQSLYKHSGDTVNAGDVIASVGQSGGRSQPGLYFGIRKKGLPIDPLEWCKK
ncbi:MAG: peptidoglycan DD-metalloendopeptidase family protein [Methylococcaceae bacterium]|nr:peptidoglycan DD-metalloendopeptidase family protein [Methylococcaceae bacterium]